MPLWTHSSNITALLERETSPPCASVSSSESEWRGLPCEKSELCPWAGWLRCSAPRITCPSNVPAPSVYPTVTVAELTQSSLQDSPQTAQGENTSSLSLPYQPQVGIERQLGKVAHLHLPSSSRDQPGASLVPDPITNT
ncbi:protein BEAN1 isoform X3 [Homo sapiens]|uniref:protein BEAN1 isoform X3 n=1 Tax=Homo sapiens TaxID=9606 RepID=UPI0005CFFC70|nr:protein BEAN1 isoform X3 [Homo sapiens]XP_054235635.1 protein BEAN1 isoform X3 [Homo sapiens]|eukprot:XP_011521196.1 protein BEAN1 isoform X4 [Homo sapiens]